VRHVRTQQKCDLRNARYQESFLLRAPSAWRARAHALVCAIIDWLDGDICYLVDGYFGEIAIKNCRLSCIFARHAAEASVRARAREKEREGRENLRAESCKSMTLHSAYRKRE